MWPAFPFAIPVQLSQAIVLPAFRFAISPTALVTATLEPFKIHHIFVKPAQPLASPVSLPVLFVCPVLQMQTAINSATPVPATLVTLIMESLFVLHAIIPATTVLTSTLAIPVRLTLTAHIRLLTYVPVMQAIMITAIPHVLNVAPTASHV